MQQPVSPNDTPAAPAIDVVVVGAGIAGLTAAALLADSGLQVVLLEAHHQCGGCAGTFRRGPWTFDVGATQVAGLEPGGIHRRLFDHFNLSGPTASPLDPACVVDLGDGRPAVQLWRDPQRWRAEREHQFPGSGRFWQWCSALHAANWRFAARDPVLPPRNSWDLGQLLAALGPANLASGLLSTATIADLQRWSGCGSDQRLRRFLDLQLKLYSQEPADRTAALYGATVLAMGQEPLGLWHLHGSMQRLSSALETALQQGGGDLRLRHRVQRLQPAANGTWQVSGDGPGGRPFALNAADVVVTVPPQSLLALMPQELPAGYRRRLANLAEPSGALVFYGAIERRWLPPGCPSHLQSDWREPGSLFVTVSQEGDGRAPAGQATVIASVFTAAKPWFNAPLDQPSVRQETKQQLTAQIKQGLASLLQVEPTQWLHDELATPRAFAHWCGRPLGYVGGLGQHPSRFGPFGLASRTPVSGLWLCGDSIYPGEGTAGVSLSALMACRQLLAQHGTTLTLRQPRA
ncbi:MAG: C-3',4' desaturase CrtD [Cyanobacteria bacterium K_DeepCast_35m_m2_023]|nr:C-3',4' desaturase CrtD [Cyanobacteria bacterium K_DeepCast_35m_m2_023]